MLFKSPALCRPMAKNQRKQIGGRRRPSSSPACPGRAVLRRAGQPLGLFQGVGCWISVDDFYALFDAVEAEAGDPTVAIRGGTGFDAATSRGEVCRLDLVRQFLQGFDEGVCVGRSEHHRGRATARRAPTISRCGTRAAEEIFAWSPIDLLPLTLVMSSRGMISVRSGFAAENTTTCSVRASMPTPT